MGKTGVVRIADDRINEIVQKTFAELIKEKASVAKELILQQVISDFNKQSQRKFPERLFVRQKSTASFRKPIRNV